MPPKNPPKNQSLLQRVQAAKAAAEDYNDKLEQRLEQRRTTAPSAPAPSAPAPSAQASSAQASSAQASSAQAPSSVEARGNKLMVYPLKKLPRNSSANPALQTWGVGAGGTHSRWPGPVNVHADRNNPSFSGTLNLLRDENSVLDSPYSQSPGSDSSYDSERSVQIPASELAQLLLYLPEDFLKQPKFKRPRRDGGSAAAVQEKTLVFTNGEVASEDWNSLRELIASCPDIFGDEDTSSDFNPRQNPSTEDPNEETVQDPQRDPGIIEASREMFGLLLGQLLSIEDELERYRWFKEAYERSKSSLQDVFRKLKSPECFESEGSKQMLVDVLGKLVDEGREYANGKRIEPTKNRKINQAFLDSKSSSATTITFQTKEEFVIFILSIYADSIHDANRIEDAELKTKVVKLKKACARNLVAKMYPTPQSTPFNVGKLLQIIDESHKSTFETELMDHFAKISKCKEVRPFDLASSISESSGVIFTDNASMRNEVKKTNSVISIQTLLDAGASNRSDLCFFDPYNVRFIWESEQGAKENNGEYYEFLVTQTVSIPSSSRGMECAYFALDNFKRLSWRTGRGHKEHKKAVVERLPLCTITGGMDGCFVPIMLRHVAERVWQQAVKSVGEPDGLSALPLISLKWSGDSSMGIESVLGYKNMCGFFLHRDTPRRRRLPYIVSTDTATLSGNIALSHAICKRYNEIVENNNKGYTVTDEELQSVTTFMDDIEKKRVLISNDRSAHGGVILLLGAMLKATDQPDQPVNPYCKSVLVCSGDERVNINGRQIIRTINRKPDVKSAPLSSARAGTGTGAERRGIIVDSTDDEYSVAGSCFSEKSCVNALSFYLREPKHGWVPDTQELLKTPSASPEHQPRDTSSSSRLFPLQSKKEEFITFLEEIGDSTLKDTLKDITESIRIPDSEFNDPGTLALRLNAAMVRVMARKNPQDALSEEHHQQNIQTIQGIIKTFNQNQSKGGGFFTRSHSRNRSRNRSRSRNHHNTRYTNKRKHRLNKKSTIKHRKSYRKHKNTIKRHNIEK